MNKYSGKELKKSSKKKRYKNKTSRNIETFLEKIAI